MNKKAPPRDKLVTESYLDKNTIEIMNVVKDLYEIQGKKLDSIMQGVDELKKEIRRIDIRLSDHDVRIENIEKHLN